MPDLSSGMATTPTVAVIGSGLAGLVTALDASRAAAAAGQDIRVVVFEKNSNLGGNSAKASSGINAVNLDAGDTQELYANDTIQSGGGLSDEQLVQQLTVSA
jgi:succinate dehydrogenase/fumarate reductase flavoprotein subunit